LLIIFMVTAPLLKAGVPVELPESRAKALAEERMQVTITLARDGTIYLDNERMDVGELPSRLGSVARGPEGDLPLVTLRADKALDYGRVMAVMGELNRAGFTSISLVTTAAAVGPVPSAEAQGAEPESADPDSSGSDSEG
ncbi:MAG: biopolymer transporter ExbD, partial [Novosphingobium sp.]|nr:biopolymer transporter ExbD [Novosphingobium sp.]